MTFKYWELAVMVAAAVVALTLAGGVGIADARVSCREYIRLDTAHRHDASTMSRFDYTELMSAKWWVNGKLEGTVEQWAGQGPDRHRNQLRYYATDLYHNRFIEIVRWCRKNPDQLIRTALDDLIRKMKEAGK